ncbi:MAG: hypothetical protein UW09_C0003G0228 [candidate division TM6 bacterium GW2011_GWF2_43_87]|nr:MAG: hypothetical protein UW09_C0003G0228 [candidate division TM6 bacterium GW2011_GWF2_43_87]
MLSTAVRFFLSVKSFSISGPFSFSIAVKSACFGGIFFDTSGVLNESGAAFSCCTMASACGEYSISRVKQCLVFFNRYMGALLLFCVCKNGNTFFTIVSLTGGELADQEF